MSRRYAWYALGLLSLMNFLNYLDRNVLFAVFEPIKRDLHLTDTQLGWLGSAYVIVYALSAIPLGVLSDLKSRRAVIATGLTVWSGFTALGGLARHYWQLFSARAMVGIGESAYSPAAQSLIATYFPGERRAFALGIFWAGLALGGGGGIWLGGVLQHLYGWRATFLAVALPGLLLATLAANLRDPARLKPPLSLRRQLRRFEITSWRVLRATWPIWSSLIIGAVAWYVVDKHYPVESQMDVAAFSTTVGLGIVVMVIVAIRRLVRQRPERRARQLERMEEFLQAGRTVLGTPTLIWLFIGGAMITFAMNGLVAWSPSYMERALGLPPQDAGRVIGIWGLLGGTLGVLFGGRLADELVKLVPSGRVIAGSAGFLIGGPLCIALLAVNDLDLFIPLFFASFFFFTWYNGPMTAAIFDVVPLEVGASVMGAYVFFTHIAGDAVAYPLVGFLSDRLGIRTAVMILPLVAIVGGLVALVATRTIENDMLRLGRVPGGTAQPTV